MFFTPGPAAGRSFCSQSKARAQQAILYIALAGGLAASPHQPLPTAEAIALKSSRLTPTRILWQSGAGVENAGSLLVPRPAQPIKPDPNVPCTLVASAAGDGGILLDFGTELNGSLELATVFPQQEPNYQPRLRIRFGESASEAMSEPEDRQSGNDYAIRDQIVTLPWLGTKLVGPCGFRFARLDAVDARQPVPISFVRAILTVQNAPRIGSFRCEDERLNKIWVTGAYTVQLNLQDYLWDGIKRDRLVWIGDLQPQVAVVQAVYGANPAVPRSLDLIRDNTPPDQWMHGISSYSLWWVLIQERWWMQNGDRGYLDSQRSYLKAMLENLMAHVGADGRETLDGMRYLDWPTWEDKPAIAAGLQALLVLTLDSGGRLMTALGESATAQACAETARRARTVVDCPGNAKAALALQSLAGQRDPRVSGTVMAIDGLDHHVSPFFGFYELEALGQAHLTDAALDVIRSYWGAMLDRGATTFWEDFDLDWLRNSGRIDELTPAGTRDLHGDFGIYGSAGFRKSLCHGWAAGPTAFLSEHVLGFRPLEPGCKQLLVCPHLGNLRWAEGTYPTPRGPVTVRHERRADGTIKSEIHAPPGIEIVRDEPAQDSTHGRLP